MKTLGVGGIMVCAKRNCLFSQGPRGEEGEEGSEGDPVSDHSSCRTKPQMTH